MTNLRKKGMLGERWAASELEKIGYQIIQRNYWTQYGEIDIIARKDDLLLFVEVKTRFSERFGHPEISVSARKRKHMIESIAAFLQEQYADWQGEIRIDVASIRFDPNKKEPQIEWFENAIYE
ncbi:MAG: YraN family protein [Anaerolineae bacterium]|jgi:putative endonuclease|nr:YraN family protein [Anaerolineae bacterium]